MLGLFYSNALCAQSPTVAQKEIEVGILEQLDQYIPKDITLISEN